MLNELFYTYYTLSDSEARRPVRVVTVRLSTLATVRSARRRHAIMRRNSVVTRSGIWETSRMALIAIEYHEKSMGATCVHRSRAFTEASPMTERRRTTRPVWCVPMHT